MKIKRKKKRLDERGRREKQREESEKGKMHELKGFFKVEFDAIKVKG